MFFRSNGHTSHQEFWDDSDTSQRKHVLTVSFPPGYPAVPLALEPLEVPDCDTGQRSLSQQAAAEALSWNRESGLGAVIHQAQKVRYDSKQVAS
jgi:hypothetical protein